MSLSDLKAAFDIINSNSQYLVVKNSNKVSKESIEKAEGYLELSMPETYKFFLSTYGFISLGGMEIYGIIGDDFEKSGIPDAVWLTKQERNEFDLPHQLIIIRDVGNGDFYCLDTSQTDEQGECPVVVWPIGGYEQTPVLEVVAKDFGEFFLNMVKQQIEYKKHSES